MISPGERAPRAIAAAVGKSHSREVTSIPNASHAVLAIAWLALTACGGGGGTRWDGGDASGQWACPAHWVANARGGCGPAVFLCGPDGGAMTGACAREDLSHGTPVTDPDGGIGSTFFLASDGGIRGGWHEPGDDAGPPSPGERGVPSAMWSPDAGIPSCPPSWTRLADGTCDPGLRTDCPAMSRAIPGGGCTPTADVDCPAGEYADVSAESAGARVVYVRAGADVATQDGTIAHPFATIGSGIAAAGASGWVLVAAGEYPESIAVHASVHIVGVCAARVSIRASGVNAILASLVGLMLDVRRVGVLGGRTSIAIRSDAHATFTAVRIADAGGRAIEASSSSTTVTLDRVLIEGTLATPPYSDGIAIAALSGAQVTASHSVVHNSVGVAVTSSGSGAHVTLADSIVENTQWHADRTNGEGLVAFRGGTIDATRAVIRNNHTVGAEATGDGAVIHLEDVVVRDTATDGAGIGGIGVAVGGGGIASVTRVLAERNGNAEVAADGAGSRLTVSDSVLRATQPSVEGTGYGAFASAGSVIEATRVIAEGNSLAAMSAEDDGTRLSVTDSILRGTLSPAPELVGAALLAWPGAIIDAHAVLAVDHRVGALAASGPGAVVRFSGGVVRGTRPRDGAIVGAAALVNDSARIEIATSLLADSVGAGVLAEGAAATVTDCIVDATRRPASTTTATSAFGLLAHLDGRIDAVRTLVSGSEAAGVFVNGGNATLADCVVRGSGEMSEGRGAIIQIGSHFDARRSVFEENAGVGIFVHGLGAVATIEDTVIRGTHSLAPGAFGDGLTVQEGATTTVTRSLIDSSREHGVLVLLPGSTASLDDVLIRDVRPSARGFGIGLAAFGGGQVTATRLGLRSVSGAAIASVPYADARRGRFDGSSIDVTDLFVADVRSSTVQFDGSGSTPAPSGGIVAYGVHAGGQCRARVERAVIENGGYGFYNAEGTLEMRHGVITGQLDGFGASKTGLDPPSLVLEDIAHAMNANEWPTVNVTLPEAAALPPPTAICDAPGCP